jgi:hypothetical protein
MCDPRPPRVDRNGFASFALPIHPSTLANWMVPRGPIRARRSLWENKGESMFPWQDGLLAT